MNTSVHSYEYLCSQLEYLCSQLGDQTLYSWMTANGTGARNVFHILPCGWNRQIGTHMAGWPGFWQVEVRLRVVRGWGFCQVEV